MPSRCIVDVNIGLLYYTLSTPSYVWNLTCAPVHDMGIQEGPGKV